MKGITLRTSGNGLGTTVNICVKTERTLPESTVLFPFSLTVFPVLRYNPYTEDYNTDTQIKSHCNVNFYFYHFN